MPAAPLVEPLNPLVWIVGPSVLAAASSLVLATPLDIFGLRLPEPATGIVCAFAWAVIRPSVLAPFALVVIGLFDDLLWGNELGLWPLALLGAYGFTLFARSAIAGEGFWARWAWYVGASTTAFFVAYVFRSALAREILAPMPVALQWGATLLLFWFAERLIARFQDADVRFR